MAKPKKRSKKTRSRSTKKTTTSVTKELIRTDPTVEHFPLAIELTPEEQKDLAARGVKIRSSVPWEFLVAHSDCAERCGITIEHIEEGKLTPAELLLMIDDLGPEYLVRDAEAIPRVAEEIYLWENPEVEDEADDR